MKKKFNFLVRNIENKISFVSVEAENRTNAKAILSNNGYAVISDEKFMNTLKGIFIACLIIILIFVLLSVVSVKTYKTEIRNLDKTREKQYKQMTKNIKYEPQVVAVPAAVIEINPEGSVKRNKNNPENEFMPMLPINIKSK